MMLAALRKKKKKKIIVTDIKGTSLLRFDGLKKKIYIYFGINFCYFSK